MPDHPRTIPGSHMRPSEVALFFRFADLAPIPTATYRFDYRLGQGMTLDPDWPPEIARMARALTQRRVDVLATTPAGSWVLEIKERAGPSAVGQLLTYRELYMLQERPPQAPRLGIIADRNSYDMHAVYALFGIELFLV